MKLRCISLPTVPALPALPALAIAVLVLAAAACRVEPPPEQDYVAHVEAVRRAKDAVFLKESDVVPEHRKQELLPLSYFPVNPLYNVPAELKLLKQADVIDMAYSTGEVQQMRRVGTLEFSINGQPLKLAAFVEATRPNRLFVPFRDRTSETETYHTGRFLDLDRTATGLYELDFNLAYNPNCYFSPLYSCPVPPKENDLQVSIEAGEKIKSKS